LSGRRPTIGRIDESGELDSTTLASATVGNTLGNQDLEAARLQRGDDVRIDLVVVHRRLRT
jgi:hypothetical protein